jgi:hypothetical protein
MVRQEVARDTRALLVLEDFFGCAYPRNRPRNLSQATCCRKHRKRFVIAMVERKKFTAASMAAVFSTIAAAPN